MPKKNKYLSFVLLISMLSSCTTVKVLQQEVHTSGSIYNIDTSIVNDLKVNQLVNTYKIGLDSIMNHPLGTSAQPLTKAQPDCTMGHLVSDALLEAAKAKDSLVQVAVSNQGGIRINYLSPGNITLGNMYEIMPFDNMLVVLEVPGEVMMQWCQHIANKGGWPVSNISFEIEDKKAINIIVNQKPLNEQLVYRVATSDYLANGGDDCEFLRKCKRYTYNVLMRDAMIQYVQHHTAGDKPLNIQLENRIKYAD